LLALRPPGEARRRASPLSSVTPWLRGFFGEPLYTETVDAGESTVLWRLYRAVGPQKGDRVRAVILPGGPPFTLAFFANDDMDRAENYDSMDLAIFRSNEIRQSLLKDNWKED
jgi:hypothetical protein